MISQNARVRDPYMDRRSGEDRRAVYDSDYFENDGVERRHGKDRRQKHPHRGNARRFDYRDRACLIAGFYQGSHSP